jgi:hypothetical protein
MSKITKQVEGAQGATSQITGLMNVPVTANSEGKTGEFHTVWSKKDLSGSSSQMAKKADDRVTVKGDEVTDPETGTQFYLVRIHRGKRVWYGKTPITEELRAQFAAAAPAAATESVTA